jgi:hypothetical protein
MCMLYVLFIMGAVSGKGWQLHMCVWMMRGSCPHTRTHLFGCWALAPHCCPRLPSIPQKEN